MKNLKILKKKNTTFITLGVPLHCSNMESSIDIKSGKLGKTGVLLLQHQGRGMCDHPGYHQWASGLLQLQLEQQMQSPEIRKY